MAGFSEDELVSALRTILAEDSAGVLLGLGDDAALVELAQPPVVLTADR
jgi:thiamine monophosphate kinase